MNITSNWWPFITCLLLLVGLSGCCEQQTCDCFDERENDIRLQFDLDSLQQGYRSAEVRGAYVVRYAKPGFTAALDTARQKPLQSSTGSIDFYHDGLILNYLFLSRTGENGGLTAYNYAIVVPQASRRYLVSDLELAGERRGNRCCTCYNNTRKRLRLDGVYIVAEDPTRTTQIVLHR